MLQMNNEILIVNSFVQLIALVEIFLDAMNLIFYIGFITEMMAGNKEPACVL